MSSKTPGRRRGTKLRNRQDAQRTADWRKTWAAWTRDNHLIVDEINRLVGAA